MTRTLAPHWPRLDVKLVNAASPFINYVFPLDMISAVLVYGGIALGVAVGWLIVAPRAVAAVVILPVAYFVLPFDLMSASFLDMRFAVMFGFLLFAAVDPAPQHVPITGEAAAWPLMRLVADVTLGRTALPPLAAQCCSPCGWQPWRTCGPSNGATSPSCAPSSPPSRQAPRSSLPTFHRKKHRRIGMRDHAAAVSPTGCAPIITCPRLLLIERGAFWPVLFANPAQQPIRLRPAYAKLAREAHDIPSHARLVDDPDSALPALCDFDFVLMLEAGADPDLANFIPACLALEARSDFAALFRVLRELAGLRFSGQIAITIDAAVLQQSVRHQAVHYFAGFGFFRAVALPRAGRDWPAFLTRAFFTFARFTLAPGRRNENKAANASTPPPIAIHRTGKPQPPVTHAMVRRTSAVVSKIISAAKTTTTARARRIRISRVVPRTFASGQGVPP